MSAGPSSLRRAGAVVCLVKRELVEAYGGECGALFTEAGRG